MSMKNREILIVLKNAVSNVLRGGSAAVVALVLPPFLTRTLSVDQYGAWALILQFSAYASYLDFGTQLAVGRFVAHSNELGDVEERNTTVSTALAMMCIAALLAAVGLVALAALMPRFFTQMPVNLYGTTRIALFLVGGSLALGLPAGVFNAVFIGMQRNGIPATIVAGSRLLGAIAIIVLVQFRPSLAYMGATLALVNVGSYLVQYAVLRRVASDVRFSLRLVTAKAFRSLVKYCSSVSVFYFCMILVNGLDLVLVGRFEFRSVAPYAIAAAVITFLAGLQNAIFTAILPNSAVLHARGEREQLGSMLTTATRYGMCLLLVTGLPIFLCARVALNLWAGPAYGMVATPILQMLIIANIVRLAGTPYTVLLLGTGQQHLATASPLMEGISNLIVSVIAGYYWGAIGVAFGTLVGAVIGLTAHVFYNLPRTAAIQYQPRALLRRAFLTPLLCSLPLFLGGVALAIVRPPALVQLVIVAIATGVTVLSMAHWGNLIHDLKAARA